MLEEIIQNLPEYFVEHELKERHGITYLEAIHEPHWQKNLVFYEFEKKWKQLSIHLKGARYPWLIREDGHGEILWRGPKDELLLSMKLHNLREFLELFEFVENVTLSKEQTPKLEDLPLQQCFDAPMQLQLAENQAQARALPFQIDRHPPLAHSQHPGFSDVLSPEPPFSKIDSTKTQGAPILPEDIIITANLEISTGSEVIASLASASPHTQQQLAQALVLRPNPQSSATWLREYFTTPEKAQPLLEQFRQHWHQIPCALADITLTGHPRKFQQFMAAYEHRRQHNPPALTCNPNT